MFLTKHSITVVADSTGNDTQYTPPVNGRFYGFQYTPTTSADTVISTTATFTLNRESDTDNYLWNSTFASTDGYWKFPRKTMQDTTGSTVGNTTDYPMELIPLVNERVRFSMTISTASGLTGDIDLYFEGA